MPYCTYCGKELVQEWTERWHSETGEKTFRNICPDEPCKHTGHLNERFSERKFLIFDVDYFLCKRCGAREKAFSFWSD